MSRTVAEILPTPHAPVAPGEATPGTPSPEGRQARTSRPSPRERELASIIEAYNDVTEQLKDSHDRLQQQVGRLRTELADKNRELARRERLAALGEMAAGLAHEIRNPLGSIQLFASLLERDLDDRPALQTTASKISRGVRSLDRLVSDVLAFAGDVALACREVAVATLVSEAVDLTAAAIERHQIDLHVDVSPAELNVWADPEQLRQVVGNLLLNAVQAVGDHGRVDVRARWLDTESAVEITVADDGPGIAPELLDRVFNPFFTTRDAGTGLGLAIVHRIVESHAGSVVAGNRPTGGAVFRVTLPTHPAAAVAAQTEDRHDENLCH